MKNMNTINRIKMSYSRGAMWSWEQPIPCAVNGSRSYTSGQDEMNEKNIHIKIKQGWHEINWKQVETKIKDLQEEIVIATLNNNKREIYRLQKRILRSFEGRALAVRKVVTNRGGRTSGIDNIKWTGPLEYWNAIKTLDEIIKNPKNYEAQPVRRVYIPKPNSKEMRPLGIPTMIDRALQALYVLGLDPAVETVSDLNSFGFRKNRSTHDAITAIRSLLDKNNHPEWILEIDIKKCFDRIDHNFLLKHTPICHKDLLKKWLTSGIMEELNFFETTQGTPQGSLISPVLSNVAFNGLENWIKVHNPLKKGISPGVHLIRYADDMIVTSKSRETAEKNKQLIIEFLKERGLELNEQKTVISHIKDGFNFLGFNIKRFPFRKILNNKTNQKTVLIIKPSEKGIVKLKQKLKNIFDRSKPMEGIVRELNPILRGWAEHKIISYHTQPEFIKLDHWIYTNMMRWARAQATKTGLKNIMKKYLHQTETRRWNWGTSKSLTLINLAEIPIITLRPLKLDRNPYLKEHSIYFNERKERTVFTKFKMAILKKYKHLCPRCGESLHNGEPLELHHIIPKKTGGKHSMKNTQPLHRICHQQITHQKV